MHGVSALGALGVPPSRSGEMPEGESSPCVSDPCELGTSATGLGA